MSKSTCFVTGGAGFIGCAISGSLAHRFDEVVVLDCLHPQIHPVAVRPAALDPRVDFRLADITDPDVWDRALSVQRPDVVVHLAAETGTGQSLRESSRHAHVNVVGTTTMLDAFARHDHVPRQIVLSSSRAVYGEGAWRRADGTIYYPLQRDREQLARAEWNFAGASPVPFSASRTELHPTSIYGATKLAQEHILESWCNAFGTKLAIPRLQNVYGPGQSLTNSYTGIVTLFAQVARNKGSIPLYEDGLMLRDFVYIEDVANALLALIDAAPDGTSRYDIGGETATIEKMANFMTERYLAPAPHVSGQFRYGDVRHASSDMSETLSSLQWSPQWSLDRGLESLCVWIDRILDDTRPL
jgi:dTDP-L-rhamnose 4-epimerase